MVATARTWEGIMAQENDMIISEDVVLPRDDMELRTDQLLPDTGLRLPPHFDDDSRDDDRSPSIGQFIA
jgi:hypothetical protein